MTDRVIPMVDTRRRNSVPSVFAPPSLQTSSAGLSDSRGRHLHDLRISVTDRCNFRCVYCMPKHVFGQDYPYLKQAELLSFEEIRRIAAQFVAVGVEKIRLTGGEPLLRRHLENLIEMLAVLRTPEGLPVDLTLTTNGSLLRKKAQSLKQAGLKRLTVSLDALDDAVFKRMNDVDFSVNDVLDGIEAAHQAGFRDIKVNMVVKKGWNDDQIVPMARYFHKTPFTLRFIEYMDVGASNGWKMEEVVPSREVIERIGREVGSLRSLEPHYTGEVAQRWQYADNGHEVGVISSVTQAFCSTCTRARLSTEGQLYTCLFATQGHDFRSLLRGDAPGLSGPASDEQLRNAITNVWMPRGDRYSEIRTAQTQQRERIEMSYIGG
jgi:cyclic pyranopterin phosphate synthase